MKKVFFLTVIVMCISSAHLLAQSSADSIIEKQLSRQKQKLGLTDGQFVEYKRISKEYFDIIGNLAITTNGDSLSFKNQAQIQLQKKQDELLDLLTPQQMELYIIMMRKTE